MHDIRKDGLSINGNNLQHYNGTMAQVEDMMADTEKASMMIALPLDVEGDMDQVKQWLKDHAVVTLDSASHNYVYRVPTFLQA